MDQPHNNTTADSLNRVDSYNLLGYRIITAAAGRNTLHFFLFSYPIYYDARITLALRMQ